MAKWADDITKALTLLGGIAPLSDIYEKVKEIRPLPHPKDLSASVRGTIESYSSDSQVFSGEDLFFSVEGIGKGVWGLRSFEKSTPTASDLDETGIEIPLRQKLETYRILRDTRLARQVKLLHRNECQICGQAIVLPDGGKYSEAHHVQPLGSPHNGPDIVENIIVVCPNHHVMLDYFAMKLEVANLRLHPKHSLGEKYVRYHNERVR